MNAAGQDSDEEVPMHTHGNCERCDAQEAKIARLTLWIGDLQAGLYINCVYCGFRYGPGESTPATLPEAGETAAGSALRAHVAQCPDHPMSKLATANAAQAMTIVHLRTALGEIRNYWNGSQTIGAMSDACERMIEMADVALAAAQGGTT